jgi:hypothetical protein
MFEDFKEKHTNDGYRWAQYWRDMWVACIDLYVKMSWHMIPLGFKNKRPAAGYDWTTKPLTREEAIEHVMRGNNLGIVAERKLIFLDYDLKDHGEIMTAPPLEIIAPPTMKISTPNGLLILTTPPFKAAAFSRLKAAYPSFDAPRTDIMYVAVPMSETCKGEKGNVHACAKHDWQVREWIDPADGELWSFAKYVKEVFTKK